MKSTEAFNRIQKTIATNRKARFEFEIIQTLECGVILQGTEVKALRTGKCSLQDAYAGFKSKLDEELYLFNLHISPYEHGNRENHEPKRMRKLLLNKKEAIKLKTAVSEKGITLIPLSVYFSGHLVKIELGLCRAKKKYDKRETTKKRESEIEIRRKFKM